MNDDPLDTFLKYVEIDNVIKLLTEAMNSPILTNNIDDDINVVIASIKDYYDSDMIHRMRDVIESHDQDFDRNSQETP